MREKKEKQIRNLRGPPIAKKKVTTEKPAIDIRYDENNIVSHDANTIQSVPVNHSSEILQLAQTAKAEVVGIDEAQFFDAQLPEVCEKLALKGTRVIIAGLDMDYLGKPFGTMPHLLSVAEYITKLHAICMVCGNLASHSYRKLANEEQVLLGAKDLYEPRCRICYHLTNETEE